MDSNTRRALRRAPRHGSQFPHPSRVAELQREVATLEEMQRSLQRIQRRMLRRLAVPERSVS